MSLRARLLWYVGLGVALTWALALALSVHRARHEVDELFDTELIRLARQVQSTLGVLPASSLAPPAAPRVSPALAPGNGQADLADLAVAVWDRQGRLLLTDSEGARLPHRPRAAGFADVELDGDAWRVYYLQALDGRWLVAAGQKAHERDELILDLITGQAQPWLLGLPVLLGAVVVAVGQALRPLRRLVGDIGARGAQDLRPLPARAAPTDLRPLVDAMNGLFARIHETLARERAFTADAAHELRTPLAALRAQWDVLRRATDAAERARAEAKLAAGLERMDRLVTQMLALSRLDTGDAVPARCPADWPRIMEQVTSDCLPLADRRRIELACEWPDGGEPPAVMVDAHLFCVMLRNLLDNAVRHAPEGTQATLRVLPDRLEVDNAGPGLPDVELARLGDRFYRPDGTEASGSGLGLSIVRRIAALHGMTVCFGRLPAGDGMRVTLLFPSPPARPVLT